MTASGVSRLNTVELFCAAARARSFTAAATELGTTPSAISKAVQRLENRLGLKLFQRSTRAVRLTDEGQTYYATCRSALETIQDVEKTLMRHRSMPRGVLRLSLPYTYGVKRVLPLLPRYVERYLGQVKVEVSLSNAVIDFVAEEVDMSIRLGPVGGSGLVVRKLHDARACVVASPTYLRQHGIPHRPEDLRQHTCLGLRMPDTGRLMPWTFATGDGGVRTVALQPGLTFDHPLGVLTAALNDAGFARLLDFTVHDDLISGRLVEVLTDVRPPPLPVSAVYQSNRHVPAKVRTFLDFLLEAG
ncbi:MAG: LysR family transcriptional regulator [Pseudomonadota bacterium]